MFIIPVYEVITGRRVTEIPQWLIDIEGTELVKRGVNIASIYKILRSTVNQNTFQFIVYNRHKYNPNNTSQGLIGRYDYTYSSENTGTEYITLYR